MTATEQHEFNVAMERAITAVNKAQEIICETHERTPAAYRAVRLLDRLEEELCKIREIALNGETSS